MVFNGIFFLLYFLPVFLIVYYLLPSSWRNYWTLLCSLLFYAWGAPKYVFFLLASTIANYYITRILHNADKDAIKKRWLILSVMLSLGLLVLFKYTNFIVANFNIFLSNIHAGPVSWHAIALPIGISFCTFHSISYSIDVYRKIRPPCDRLTDYMLYIFLFPKLVAGPIVRFNVIADEISDRKRNETASNVLKGLMRFTIGLSKKVLIANVLGYYADLIYNVPADTHDSLSILLGTIAYSFQIYFDFAGYSDMAIGLGKMIGFSFPENFIAPYISRNITEFWRRWHITLMTFMRDYLYVPLCAGGRVKTKFHLLFNLWLVFLISGLWHGANWTFLAWGAYHGLFLIVDRLFYKKLSAKLGLLSVLINYLVVLFSWIIFRSDSIQHIGDIMQGIFRFTANTGTEFFSARFWIILGCGVFFSFAPLHKKGSQLMERIHDVTLSFRGMLVLSGVCIVLLIVSISSIITSGFNPFIYFRF